MLEPFSETIDRLGFVCTHCGHNADPSGNRVYAVAAIVRDGNGSEACEETFVRYRRLTARERHLSNVSAGSLSSAPESGPAAARMREFLRDLPFVFFLGHQCRPPDVRPFCGSGRVVDLGLAAEFFLPQLEGHSPARLWEHLNRKQRQKISFSAMETARLAVKLVDHICGTLLNDQMHPEAAAVRYYLERSDTLFGTALTHVARAYKTYFGGLFDPCSLADTGDWTRFLEKARQTNRNSRPVPAGGPVSTTRLGPLLGALSAPGKPFQFRPEQVAYAEHVLTALNDWSILTIEAGTGTGKTQGYLVPVLEYLSHNKAARVAVSTYNKNLQEQLVQREITLTRSVFPPYGDIPVALLKGKSSYVCAEKLDNILDEQWTGAPLLAWLYFVNMVYRFRETDLDSVGETVLHYLGRALDFSQLVGEVSAKDGCTLRHLRCPAQVVTADAYYARLVVTNHHKLALLDQDTVLAGLFTHYVVDEANHFENAVRSAFGVEFRSRDAGGAVAFLQRTSDRLLQRSTGDPARLLTLVQREAAVAHRYFAEFRESLAALDPGPAPGTWPPCPPHIRVFRTAVRGAFSKASGGP